MLLLPVWPEQLIPGLLENRQSVPIVERFDVRLMQLYKGRGRQTPARHSEGGVMSIIGWIVLGLIAGFIASHLVNRRGEGLLLDIVLGIVGAIVGGWVFALFGAEGVSGFNLYSMLVAVIGAVVVLAIYHLVAGRRAY
jgi:uncharacterized membrane protein YeaQ/YmgE (transglycosylase-associated protein family)